MTTESHLALMSLMNDIEAPTKTYRSALRKAWATETDSPENNAAKAKGNAALEEIEGIVRQWVVKHPVTDLCGFSRGGYDPCARPAGHVEAYCSNASGTQYFLGPDRDPATAPPAA
jgi:hypothetical protein